MPTVGFYWYQAHLAAAYGQLDDPPRAHEAAAALLALNREFAANVWQELDFWTFTADDPFNPLYVEGLRKVGLDIPEQPD